VGLGLAITERAIVLHGGTVRAANRAEGGLLVEISLPLLRAEVSRLRDTLTPAASLGVDAN
jgi:signal transduction histidine kinase